MSEDFYSMRVASSLCSWTKMAVTGNSLMQLKFLTSKMVIKRITTKLFKQFNKFFSCHILGPAYKNWLTNVGSVSFLIYF